MWIYINLGFSYSILIASILSLYVPICIIWVFKTSCKTQERYCKWSHLIVNSGIKCSYIVLRFDYMRGDALQQQEMENKSREALKGRRHGQSVDVLCVLWSSLTVWWALPRISLPGFTNHDFVRRLLGSGETQNIGVRPEVQFNSLLSLLYTYIFSLGT